MHLWLALLTTAKQNRVLPTAGAGATVSLYFSLPLLKLNRSECMVCREVNALGLHMMIGTVLPTLISWHGNMLQAEAYQTYRTPQSQHFFSSKTRLHYLKQTKKVFIDTNRHSFKKVGFNWTVQLVSKHLFLFYYSQTTSIRHYFYPGTCYLDKIYLLRNFL